MEFFMEMPWYLELIPVLLAIGVLAWLAGLTVISETEVGIVVKRFGMSDLIERNLSRITACTQSLPRHGHRSHRALPPHS